MRVAVKHQVPVWVEVDLKAKTIDKVVVDDESLSKPIEYRVILDDLGGVYDTTRYPGKKMAKATRKILDDPEKEWPSWNLGW